MEKLTKYINGFYKDFDPAVEQMLIAQMFDYAYKNMDKKYRPSFFDDVQAKKFKGNAEKYAAFLMNKSVFVSKAKVEELLKSSNLDIVKKDPALLVKVLLRLDRITLLLPIRKLFQRFLIEIGRASCRERV